MSLKQKEEITIWAFKDGKKGHEKHQMSFHLNILTEIFKHDTENKS